MVEYSAGLGSNLEVLHIISASSLFFFCHNVYSMGINPLMCLPYFFFFILFVFSSSSRFLTPTPHPPKNEKSRGSDCPAQEPTRWELPQGTLANRFVDSGHKARARYRTPPSSFKTGVCPPVGPRAGRER